MAGAYLARVGIDIDDTMRKIQFQDEGLADQSRRPVSKVIAARLPGKPPGTLWDINISDACVSAVEQHDEAVQSVKDLPGVVDARGGLCCPSFCHAHVHLDKCFLLADDKFQDLQMVKGDFSEAMDLTAKAKSRFEHGDLIRRGRRLIDESLRYGVTHMRAFVEVDEVVELRCLDAAVQLKEEYRSRCHLQICAFAQLAIFSGEDNGERRRALMRRALTSSHVDVVGSTPYVEDDLATMQQNITWTILAALETAKHVDFHLDYNLDPKTQPMVFNVLQELQRVKWLEKAEGRQVTLGHCTRLTLFSVEDWKRLKDAIGELTVHFVGLPTSDLFMMGRPTREDRSAPKTRGTLQIINAIRDFGLSCAIAINNIGNAFTPQGSCNLLHLAGLGIAVYQAATRDDIELLFEAITTRARAAMGVRSWSASEVDFQESADLVIFESPETSDGPKSVFEAVSLPDAARIRHVIFQGTAPT